VGMILSVTHTNYRSIDKRQISAQMPNSLNVPGARRSSKIGT
jgi:hypothetical protein